MMDHTKYRIFFQIFILSICLFLALIVIVVVILVVVKVIANFRVLKRDGKHLASPNVPQNLITLLPFYIY